MVNFIAENNAVHQVYGSIAGVPFPAGLQSVQSVQSVQGVQGVQDTEDNNEQQ